MTDLQRRSGVSLGVPSLRGPKLPAAADQRVPPIAPCACTLLGARLRRDATSSGGVAPVAATPAALTAAMGALGGAEERFAFRRAVSRLYEMQSPQYIRTALRMRQGIVGTGTIDGDAGTTALGQELGVAVNTPVGQQ